MKLSKLMVFAAVLTFALGLCACAGNGSASSSSQSAESSSNPSGSATVEAAQKEAQPEEAASIYPWVVTKSTVTTASGLTSEYAYDYDGAGRLVSITGLQEEMVGYNERGVVQVDLTYGADGELSGITPGPQLSGDIAIARDSNGRVTEVSREWTEAGRMPNAGLNTAVTDFAYDADDELATSKHTSTAVEAGTSESENRKYSADADSGYDGKATSDTTESSMYNPPLVEWNDEQVMAGNGMGAGAVGKFDTHGNLVEVTTGGDTTIVYEYKQIEADRATWQPGPLSNPTLRTFAWDGLTMINYLTFFPPQLTEADVARVLAADTIDQEPSVTGALETSEASSAAEAADASGSHVETSYYTINLPESYGDVQLDYSSEIGGSGDLFIGYTTRAMADGAELFEVSCYSGNWGPEGWCSSVKLGTTSLEGLDAYLLVPWSDPSEQQAAQARAEEYAQYVTVL